MTEFTTIEIFGIVLASVIAAAILAILIRQLAALVMRSNRFTHEKGQRAFFVDQNDPFSGQ